jgi:short-subunit dehydrogenase
MSVIQVIIVYSKLFYVLFKHWFRDLFELFIGGIPLKDLSLETILITGGANGLGQGVAQRLAHLGCTLILWDVDEVNNDRVSEQLNNATKSKRIHSMKCDLTNRENIYECAKKVNRIQ